MCGMSAVTYFENNAVPFAGFQDDGDMRSRKWQMTEKACGESEND